MNEHQQSDFDWTMLLAKGCMQRAAQMYKSGNKEGAKAQLAYAMNHALWAERVRTEDVGLQHPSNSHLTMVELFPND